VVNKIDTILYPIMNVSPGYVVHPNNSLSNGSISSSVISAPGIAPYSFVWSDTSTITTPFRTALGPGTYRLTVTDSAYQPAVRIVSFTLTNYSVPVTALFGSVQSGPQNAIITQSYVYGGVPPYSVKWTPPIEYPDLLPQQALPAGNYTVSVSDSINSATISSIYTIPVIYPALVFILGSVAPSSATTSTGKIAASAVTGGSGSNVVTWSPPFSDSTLGAKSALASGNYTVTVHSSDGQQISHTYIVPTQMTLTLGTVVNGVLGNSTVTGGVAPLTVQWGHDGFVVGDWVTLTGRQVFKGTYVVSVTDATGQVVAGRFIVNRFNEAPFTHA
jgi:hypothetical protein